MPGILGRLDLLPPESFETIDESMTLAVKDGLEAVSKKGIIHAGRPQGVTGELPADLSSLDDTALGDLLNSLSRWCGYLDTELTLAAAYKKQAEVHLAKTMARVRLTLRVDSDGKKLTDSDKNDQVEVDPRVVEASYQELYHFTVWSVVRGERDKAQKDWDTISRRITQRGQEVNRNRRDINVSNTPVHGRAFVRRPQ
jgi:hypothetical protein